MISKNRIKECFLVDTDFHSESFVISSIKCLSNFICEEYSAKPWNKYNQFGKHIKPKKDMAISLKDNRSNHLQNCCLYLMYHLDDIADYLNANSTIMMLLYLMGVLLKWNCWNQFMEPLHCLRCMSPDHFMLYLSIIVPHIPR